MDKDVAAMGFPYYCLPHGWVTEDGKEFCSRACRREYLIGESESVGSDMRREIQRWLRFGRGAE